MSDDEAIQNLVSKLKEMKNDLNEQELEEFRSMIGLAVKSAADISIEENRLAKEGVDFDRLKELAKPQSAHAIMLGKQLDELLE